MAMQHVRFDTALSFQISSWISPPCPGRVSAASLVLETQDAIDGGVGLEWAEWSWISPHSWDVRAVDAQKLLSREHCGQSIFSQNRFSCPVGNDDQRN